MTQFLLETPPRPWGAEDVRCILYRSCLPLNCLTRCRYDNPTRSLRTASRRFIFDHIPAIDDDEDINDRVDLDATVKCPSEAVSAGPSPK